MKIKKLKKDLLYGSVIVALAIVSIRLYYMKRYQPAHETAVYYNRDQALNDQIIDEIQGAKKFVYFAVYTFTRQDIEDALLAAKYRGLTVIGITDTQQYETAAGQKELINQLRKAGIPVYEQNTSGIMHMKALVTDNAYASGSYNWTTSATVDNDEVLEVGHDPAIRQQYQNVLEELFKKYGN